MGYGGDPPPEVTLGIVAATLAGPLAAVAIIILLWLTT
jgi:hypothetical protein